MGCNISTMRSGRLEDWTAPHVIVTRLSERKVCGMAGVGDEMGESIKRVADVCSRIIFGEWMRRHMEWMNLFNLSNQEEGIDGRVEPGNGLLITGMHPSTIRACSGRQGPCIRRTGSSGRMAHRRSSICRSPRALGLAGCGPTGSRGALSWPSRQTSPRVPQVPCVVVTVIADADFYAHSFSSHDFQQFNLTTC